MPKKLPVRQGRAKTVPRRRPLFALFKLFVLLALLAASLAAYLFWAPVAQRASTIDVEIARGSSLREVARQLVAQGMDIEPGLLVLTARLSGQAKQIKAGNYRIEAGQSYRSLMQLLTSGAQRYSAFALIEGWSFARLRAALAQRSDLRQELAGLSDAAALAALKLPYDHPEGLFFPDTYYYESGGSDVDLLRRAHTVMQQVLEREWAARQPGLPLKSPYEALILASIVEKETGAEHDRGKVASVFINRLRIGMPLQTDPTVIYGLGERFDGNLRRRDLQADTPYNTYTRRGLPPTPLAMPGLAALRATLDPPVTPYLYFVARGDGSSQFSSSLDEHNRAVARYQKNRKQ